MRYITHINYFSNAATLFGLRGLTIFLGVFLALSGQSFAQGTIFGEVKNSNLSSPANGEITFFGFLHDSDEEIKIDLSDGSGYDQGNWFDDFQNYLTESSGGPYDYYFYNTSNGEGLHFEGIMPNNSFQREDVGLESIVWPSLVTGINSQYLSDTSVELSWDYTPRLVFHIYRRHGSSNGSFFRVDDSLGDLTSSGIEDSAFLDAGLLSGQEYDYLIIARNSSGLFSPRSTIHRAIQSSGCCLVAGDADHGGAVTIGDAVFIVKYIFEDGPVPPCLDEADSNGDNSLTIGDAVVIANYIFRDGAEPVCGTTGG